MRSVRRIWQQSQTSLARHFSRLVFIFKRTKIDLLPIDPNSCAPFSILALGYTSILRFADTVSMFVLSVLGFDNRAQIRTSVVEGVAVNVVPLSAIGYPRQSENLTVQTDTYSPFSILFNPPHIPAVQVPTVLTDPVCIVKINDGVVCHLPLQVTEGDKCTAVIGFENEGQSNILRTARAGAIVQVSDFGGAPDHWCGASRTDKMDWHRESLPPGVCPRSGSTDAGALRV